MSNYKVRPIAPKITKKKRKKPSKEKEADLQVDNCKIENDETDKYRLNPVIDLNEENWEIQLKDNSHFINYMKNLSDKFVECTYYFFEQEDIFYMNRIIHSSIFNNIERIIIQIDPKKSLFIVKSAKNETNIKHRNIIEFIAKSFSTSFSPAYSEGAEYIIDIKIFKNMISTMASYITKGKPKMNFALTIREFKEATYKEKIGYILLFPDSLSFFHSNLDLQLLSDYLEKKSETDKPKEYALYAETKTNRPKQEDVINYNITAGLLHFAFMKATNFLEHTFTNPKLKTTYLTEFNMNTKGFNLTKKQFHGETKAEYHFNDSPEIQSIELIDGVADLTKSIPGILFTNIFKIFKDNQRWAISLVKYEDQIYFEITTSFNNISIDILLN
jgi:hypothetical protein